MCLSGKLRGFTRACRVNLRGLTGDCRVKPQGVIYSCQVKSRGLTCIFRGNSEALHVLVG